MSADASVNRERIKLKHGRSALLAAFLLATASVLAAPACGERVTLGKLIANPDAYHGKALWVVASVTIDFENMTACPSENETHPTSCLWLDIHDGPYKSDEDYARYESKLKIWKRFNLQTVAIHADFDKTLKGHFSMWPGGLRNIKELSGHQSGWSFTTNAALPRTVCVGELPVPKESAKRRLKMGNLKLRDADYDGAIANFSQAIELEPGNSAHYLIRANAKQLKRDFGGAVADYGHAIDFERKYKEFMYLSRGEARELTGDFEGAIADYTRAIEINSKYADA